jgi:uncharacterized protein HemX
MIQIIIFLIATAILGGLIFKLCKTDATSGVLFLMALILICFVWGTVGYDYGQKQAARGKQKFKIEVKYQKVDSTYIPVDTLFILK